MPVHESENAKCYAAYANAFYAATAAFWTTIAAHLDTNCSECVNSVYGTQAYIDLNLAIAEAEVAYWKCRAENG